MANAEKSPRRVRVTIDYFLDEANWLAAHARETGETQAKIQRDALRLYRLYIENPDIEMSEPNNKPGHEGEKIREFVIPIEGRRKRPTQQ